MGQDHQPRKFEHPERAEEIEACTRKGKAIPSEEDAGVDVTAIAISSSGMAYNGIWMRTKYSTARA